MIRTERWESEKQFYELQLSVDLFGDWILLRNWGSKFSGRRGMKRDVTVDESAALKTMKRARARRRSQGYVAKSRLLEAIS